MRKKLRLAVVVSVALLGAIAAYLLLSTGNNSPGTGYAARLVPDELAGYKLLHLVEGEKALEIIKGIHWEPGDIRLINAAIAEYGANGSIAFRLWVGVSNDACLLVETMAQRMKMYENVLPYTAPVNHTLAGHLVYFSRDKRDSRIHAFWCEGKYVIWLEAYDMNAIPDALKQLFTFYASR